MLALNYTELGEKDKEYILKSVLDDIKNADTNKTPAYAMTFIYRKIKKLAKTDPYKDLKQKYNKEALKLYPELKEKALSSNWQLQTAARLAIAGNIIDFGIFTNIDIAATVERALRKTIEADDIEALAKDLDNTDKILYLLDNAGEIVFDKILIEVLSKEMNKKVTAVVRGAPVINDATLSDAKDIGLLDICTVIDNGTDAVGTELALCSKEFIAEFQNHDLIISKGQANFETLTGLNKKNIYFLFQAKCSVIAKHLGFPERAMLLMKNKTQEPL
ncbi:Uncharacterized conserved protein UCP006593 [Candidatus Magnetoovum chiemensis]|nr:Uncharacterized conserved protein UCP006593 [Candidatus Magnetoovum chiemensis]